MIVDGADRRPDGWLADLEAKLGLPPKTPENLSVPPLNGQKPSETSTPKAKANPHAGAHRPLHPTLPASGSCRLFFCQGCGFDVSGVVQSPRETYDWVEIPETGYPLHCPVVRESLDPGGLTMAL